MCQDSRDELGEDGIGLMFYGSWDVRLTKLMRDN